MIKRYKDFNITQEETKLLKMYGISDYKFNTDTNLIDVYSGVNFNGCKLTRFPKIRFGKINGGFHCYNKNNLTSLENCPKEITGNFDCSCNKLTSLEHCPIYVGGSFDISANRLSSLKHCPKKINKEFDCSRNELSDLEFSPSYVGGEFKCFLNKLNSIEDYPLCIIGNHTLEYTAITGINKFDKVFKIVKENEDIFKHLLDDKIKFHQMVMRIDPDLIRYYEHISPPSKSYSLLI